MQVATTHETGAPYAHNDEDCDYAILSGHVRDALHDLEGPLFTTDASGLFEAFLGGLPEHRRQHYTCNACRRFVESHGGLVTIDEIGRLKSPFWGTSLDAPFFEAALDGIRARMARVKVTGVFLSADRVWGVPENASLKSPSGAWHHFHTHAVESVAHRDPVRTAFQVMAEKREEYGMLARGLAEFPIELVKNARLLLSSGSLFRSDKCIGIAKWLEDLHDARANAARTDRRDNLLWRAVAEAPAGFCHVRSTMIGTLLEDIKAMKPFEEIKRAFDAKMDPTKYQRPTAAPTEGQIAAAESLIEKLASAGALVRRYATREEILPHALWVPAAAKDAAKADGVFGHLKPKKSSTRPAVLPPAQTVTWEKFQRTVLPDAERIEVLLPLGPTSMFAFVTASSPDAPPILQWDQPEQRNPVSWYFHTGGSYASQWGLVGGGFAEVVALTLQPSAWNGGHAHQGTGLYFVLRGAKETQKDRGLALFPEILKSEYHGIRSVIEAYSNRGAIEGREEGTACGIALLRNNARSPWNLRCHVTAKGVTQVYTLDRWD